MSSPKQKNNPQIHLLPIGRQGSVEPGTTILEAARQLGIEIESICGGRQTCEKCKVRIVEGNFPKFGIQSSNQNVSPAGPEEIACLEKFNVPQMRLSCVTQILDDVVIEIPPESMTQKQVIRKDASTRVINVNPVIQQVYLEVPKGKLGEHAGDWGRLQKVLADQTGIQATKISLRMLQKLQPTLEEAKRKVTVFIRDGREMIEILPGYQEGMFGVAIDLGTTTIAAFLCNLHTGELLASGSAMNPQIPYGEDLMSRISYTVVNPGGLETLHKAVIQEINQLIRGLIKEAAVPASKVFEIILVGNTTMTAIFLGIDPHPLGVSPFALASHDSIEAAASELKIRLNPATRVHVLPAQAGHVGADNVAVLLTEAPYNEQHQTLIVDVGTNAEIVLGNQERLFSASSPTGPAFEGGQITFGMRAAAGAIERVRIDSESKQARFKMIGDERWSDEWTEEAPPEVRPAGICGSGIIEVVAELYLAGLIDSSGRFIKEVDSPLVYWDGRKPSYQLASSEQTASGNAIFITQADVRNIQLAKAALYAGVKLLMQEAGIVKVDQIKLAGAFGSYIDPKYAMILGLIPDCVLEKVIAVGNAAGDGARMALLDREKRAEADIVARKTRYIETAVHPQFQNEFVAALDIPHKSDQFPSLAAAFAARKG